LKIDAEISAVPMGLQVDGVWLIAKVLMKGLGSKLALKPRIEIQGWNMGRPYGTASGWCLVNCKSFDERVGK
jgi:hypothetical protein